MSKSDNHPFIEFAERFSDPTQDYFNAFIAIARVEDLLYDLERVKEALEAQTPPRKRWAPWYGADIVSYYSVGFVTCLEWHARSRLTDLLTFDPTELQVNDVKGRISDRLIVQMASRKATVIQLVSAAERVQSLEKYMSTISRILRKVAPGFELREWLEGRHEHSRSCWLQPPDIDLLNEMFNFRHLLTHEIGSAVIGHPNIRETWDLDFAIEHGRKVKAIIQGCEEALTKFAPPTFPNLLDNLFRPISKLDNLKEEFKTLDARINAQIDGDLDFSDRTKRDWNIARDSFEKYFTDESQFIERADMLHWRYFDARTPLHARCMEFRIGFLRELASHFLVEQEDNPNLNDG